MWYQENKSCIPRKGEENQLWISIKSSARITLVHQSLDSAENKNRVRWLKGHMSHIHLQARERSNTWLQIKQAAVKCHNAEGEDCSALLWACLEYAAKQTSGFNVSLCTTIEIMLVRVNYQKNKPGENYCKKILLMWEGEAKSLCRSLLKDHTKQKQIHTSLAKRGWWNNLKEVYLSLLKVVTWSHRQRTLRALSDHAWERRKRMWATETGIELLYML